MVNKEWEKEFFEWKDTMESKFNKLSQAFIGITNKLNEVTSMLNHISTYYESKGDYVRVIAELK